MALRQHPQRTVLIEGHTDDVGSDETNLRLSERRAQSVQMGLQERGVAGHQITAVGKGELHPVADNSTPVGRQSNRRVELILADGQARVAADPVL
jgi:outer membrane protein OmpA-like peptidoglycan-associated protein